MGVFFTTLFGLGRSLSSRVAAMDFPVVRDRQEALQMLAKRPYRLVLCDLQMPGGCVRSGPARLRLLTGLHRSRVVAVVVVVVVGGGGGGGVGFVC